MTMFRLLRFPDPIAEGSATEPAASSPPVNPPAQPNASAQVPNQVTMTFEQVQSLLAAQRRLQEIEAEKEQAVAEEARAKELALAQKGEIETALKQTETRLSQKLAEAEARSKAAITKLHGETLSRVVTDSLPLDQFVSPHAMAQVRRSLMESLEVIEDAGGNITVRERGSYRPATDVIRERLASAEFAHCLKARTQGGAGATGSDRTPPPDDPSTRQVNNLGEALLWQFSRSQAATTPPTLDMTQSRWRGVPSSRN